MDRRDRTDASLVETYQSAGGTGPRYEQINVCVGPDVDECRRTVHEIWPNAAIPGQLSQDLPTWTHLEQAGDFIEAGYDHLYFHQIGPDQSAFFEMWDNGLARSLRSR